MSSEAKPKTALTKDFIHFVESHVDLGHKDETYVINLFDQKHIRKTVRATLVLLIWAFVNSFIDTTFVGMILVETAITGWSIFHFLPWVLFIIVNMVAKYFFMGWLDSRKIFTNTQKFLAALPSLGAFLFLSSVLKKEKLFFKVIRKYFRYVRKRGAKFVLNLLNRGMFPS